MKYTKCIRNFNMERVYINMHISVVNVRAIIAFSLTTKCMKYTKCIFATSTRKITLLTYIGVGNINTV